MSEQRFECESCNGDGMDYHNRHSCYDCRGKGFITDPALLKKQREDNARMALHIANSVNAMEYRGMGG